MSSYLNFYLVPKKSKKRHEYSGNGVSKEVEVKISEGKPLFLMSFCDSDNVYEAFSSTLNLTYAGIEECKYTELTPEKTEKVVEKYKEDINKTEERLAIDYKMLKETMYNEDIQEDIRSFEDYLKEQKVTLSNLECISTLVTDILDSYSYSDFEKVLINID